MRTARFIIVAAAVSGTILGAMPAQAAPGSHSAPIRFAVSAESVEKGSAVTLAGKVGGGRAAKWSLVRIGFRPAGATGFARIATARTNNRGEFRISVTAAASGTYQAVHAERGHRATAFDDLEVWELRTVTKTILSQSATGVDCALPAPNGCFWQGPETTVADTPITLTATMKCAQPKPSMTVAFTDSPANQLPAIIPGVYDSAWVIGGPGWASSQYSSSIGTVVLAEPLSTGGHWFVRANCPRYNGTTAIADWSVTATQQVTEKVTV